MPNADSGAEVVPAATSTDPEEAAPQAEPNSFGFEQEVPAAQAAPNPFDPASLRLDQALAEGFGVKKALTVVPVGKPNKQSFVRVNADPTSRLGPVAIIELKEAGETYLVMPDIAPALAEEVTLVTLVTAITRQGDTFLWPLRVPDQDGGLGASWHRSAIAVADEATRHWVRVIPKKSLGGYEALVATADIPDPEWKHPLEKLLEVAFGDKRVDRLDHPLVLKLKGKA